MILVLITFAVTAIVGVLLAGRIIHGKVAPWSLSFLHGSLAALGIFMLGYELVTGTITDILSVAFITFILAALGGFYLLSYHLKQSIPPREIVGLLADCFG